MLILLPCLVCQCSAHSTLNCNFFMKTLYPSVFIHHVTDTVQFSCISGRFYRLSSYKNTSRSFALHQHLMIFHYSLLQHTCIINHCTCISYNFCIDRHLTGFEIYIWNLLIMLCHLFRHLFCSAILFWLINIFWKLLGVLLVIIISPYSNLDFPFIGIFWVIGEGLLVSPSFDTFWFLMALL